MAANRFESGHDVIEVYGIEDPETEDTVTCVDVIEGFMFMMEPAELASFLTDHGYTFAGEA
jgi:hypothetical protein